MNDYQVPQFIEDESRLVGPFSFVQIFILVGGCGLALIFYRLLKGFIGIPLAVITLFFTALLTFARINEMPLYKMIIPMIKHFILPKSYQWSQPKTPNTTYNPDNKKISKSFNFNVKNTVKSNEEVDELTKILDKGNE